jgi:hypothetical protein
MHNFIRYVNANYTYNGKKLLLCGLCGMPTADFPPWP